MRYSTYSYRSRSPYLLHSALSGRAVVPPQAQATASARRASKRLSARAHLACRASNMPFVSSSGTRFHVEGPSRQRQTTIFAYFIIAGAVVVSLLMLVRLGNAASAAVASVSGASRAATMAASSSANMPRRLTTINDLVESNSTS